MVACGGSAAGVGHILQTVLCGCGQWLHKRSTGFVSHQLGEFAALPICRSSDFSCGMTWYVCSGNRPCDSVVLKMLLGMVLWDTEGLGVGCMCCDMQHAAP